MLAAKVKPKLSNKGKVPNNQRHFFDELGKQIGVRKLDDWYPIINKKLVTQHGGKDLLRLHPSSIDALMKSYPEHKWLPWKFEYVSINFWKSVDNQRNFLNWLGTELGVKQLDDWYGLLNTKKLIESGGYFVNIYYKGSAFEALKACYPEHKWLPWKFNKLQNNFWKSKENQRQFFDWLGMQLHVEVLDDWYSVAQTEVILKHGGSFLKSLYHGSPIAALLAVYPEHNWAPWKFQHCGVPSEYWKTKENMTKFLSELSEKLSIQTLDDWYRVNVLQLQQFGAWHIFRSQGGIYNVLRQQFPSHAWELPRFRTSKKTQRWLYIMLRKIYPGHEIIEDYKHPKAFFQSSKRSIQLDMYLPSLSLAFEYQGQQHYQDVGVFQPKQVYQLRDQEKRALCAKHNIKLIEIPYWWDRSIQGLLDIIQSSQQNSSESEPRTV